MYKGKGNKKMNKNTVNRINTKGDELMRNLIIYSNTGF
jgi:hypothetical protein